MRDSNHETNDSALTGAPLERTDATPGHRIDPGEGCGSEVQRGPFEVIDTIPQGKGFEVVVMRDRRPDAHMPWCAQYRGAGHYFSTLGELDAYCRGRGFKGWR